MVWSRPRAPSQEDYPTRFLEGIYAEAKCDWCKDPRGKIARSGLCWSCYRIKNTVAKLQSKMDKHKKRQVRIPFELRFDLTLGKQMARLAKAEGARYGSIHRENISGLDIEHELSSLSKHFLGKDLFFGDANLFQWSFSLSQRRLIFYVLSRLQREFLKRHRRTIAGSRPPETTNEEE